MHEKERVTSAEVKMLPTIGMTTRFCVCDSKMRWKKIYIYIYLYNALHCDWIRGLRGMYIRIYIFAHDSSVLARKHGGKKNLDK